MLDFNLKAIITQMLHSKLESISSYSLLTMFAVILSYISFIVAKKVVLFYAKKIIAKLNARLGNKILQTKLLDNIIYIVPLVFVFLFLQTFSLHERFIELSNKILLFLLVIISVKIINELLNLLLITYDGIFSKKGYSIKGYIQLIKMVNYILGAILSICAILGLSAWGILSGMGAFAAVLMVVFRDTILSFVASVQISGNNLFKIGDWIEIPSFGVDGNVVDISLHRVQVSNFDKTIVSVPTHKLLDIGVKNWRGMEESNGRRIKRALNIDFSSIKLLSLEEIQKFEGIDILKDYFKLKEEVINNYKLARQKLIDSNHLNYRELTNIGTFRAYIKEYLLKSEKIHKEDFSFLVRQLAPSKDGLPIEIYCFSKDNSWAGYEEIQADIFDHLIIAAKEFGLRIYQAPSGDLARLIKG